jgi:hypothetical protein
MVPGGSCMRLVFEGMRCDQAQRESHCKVFVVQVAGCIVVVNLEPGSDRADLSMSTRSHFVLLVGIGLDWPGYTAGWAARTRGEDRAADQVLPGAEQFPGTVASCQVYMLRE